jgi:hypothetical protein
LRDKVLPKDCSSTELPPHKFEGADENRTHDNVLPVAFAQSQQSDFKKLRNDNVVPPAFVAPSCGGANVPPARLGRAAFLPESGTLAQKLRTLLNRGKTSTCATTSGDETSRSTAELRLHKFCRSRQGVEPRVFAIWSGCSSIGIRRADSARLYQISNLKSRAPVFKLNPDARNFAYSSTASITPTQ